jgi:hypothetical protein
MHITQTATSIYLHYSLLVTADEQVSRGVIESRGGAVCGAEIDGPHESKKGVDMAKFGSRGGVGRPSVPKWKVHATSPTISGARCMAPAQLHHILLSQVHAHRGLQ